MKGWLAAVHAVILLSVSGAHAEEPGTIILADMCVTCHGPDGDSLGTIPTLTSLDEEAMRAFLIGFREGDIESTVMDRIARALTDADIEALARYFGDTTE